MLVFARLSHKSYLQSPPVVVGDLFRFVQYRAYLKMGAKIFSPSEALPMEKGIAVIIGLFKGGPPAETRKSISMMGSGSRLKTASIRASSLSLEKVTTPCHAVYDTAEQGRP